MKHTIFGGKKKSDGSSLPVCLASGIGYLFWHSLSSVTSCLPVPPPPLHSYSKKYNGVIVSEEVIRAEDILFEDWDGDQEKKQKIATDIMEIVRSHFPAGELILSAENTRTQVLLCAADIQFHVESQLEYADPEEVNELVMKVLTTILGINRIWKFLDSYYEGHDAMADLV